MPTTNEPTAPDAEEQLVAELLSWPSEIAAVASRVRPEHFLDYGHKNAFTAILSLWKRGSPIDPAELYRELVRLDRLADCGGPEYFAELTKYRSAGGRAELFADRVIDAWLLRGLGRVGKEIEYLSRNPTGSPPEVFAASHKLFADLSAGLYHGGPRAFADVLAEALDRLDRRMGGKEPGGFAAGFRDLDEIFAGFRPQELTVLAARPSVGKTACGVTVAVNAAKAGAGVLVCSLEQPDLDVAERVLASESGVWADGMRRGLLRPEHVRNVIAARDRVGGLKLWIDDEPKQDLLRVTADVRRLQAECRVDLVVLDYLQLVRPDDRRLPRHEQVSGVSSGLKRMARELDVAVLALAQLNREVEQRAGKPRLADLRESGGIEADADTVILMWRPDPPDGERAIDLDVAKQRNGPTGSLRLGFDRATYRFSDWHGGEF